MAAAQPNAPHDPADPTSAAAGAPPVVRPPTLGDFLRAARRRRQLSRDQLATAAAVSSSYIAQLETGEKTHPTVAALRALAAALDLGPPDLRHLYDLARLPPSERDDRAGWHEAADLTTAVTPDMQTFLDSLNPTQAAYFDNRLNVVSANASYARGFRGLIESGNVLRWIFTAPAAKQILVEWEQEAALTVHWFRGLMGTHENDERSARLLDELSNSPDFARMWLDEHIDFGRTTPYLQMRDPDTGELATLNAQLHSVQTLAGDTLLVYLGSTVRYPGPRARKTS
jgi:transcriptional regulator with XRE-family HTH domain